jgi:uncharacterized protein YjeT (DUF2065 family)
MMLRTVRRCLGLLLIVDGIRAFVAPQAYARMLQYGNPLVDDILDYLAESPRFMLRFSVTEIVVGICLTIR